MPNYYTPNIEINGCPEVHSIQAAMQYPVAPLTRVVLHDPTNNRMYIRSGAQTGLPAIIVYEEIPQQALPDNSPKQIQNESIQTSYAQPVNNENDYVTKTEYQNLINELFDLRNEIRSIRNGTR